jgi:hypothetical protein
MALLGAVACQQKLGATTFASKEKAPHFCGAYDGR